MKTRFFLFASGLSTLAIGSLPACAQTYTIVHAFTGKQDGGIPVAGATLDRQGNMYGVAQKGGSESGEGVIYRVDPTGQETTLHEFDGVDGGDPFNEPLTLVGGKLYGGSLDGGASQTGVLFSINTDGSDYTVLHSFDGHDGYLPTGKLQSIPGHGLVGVTEEGGAGFQSVFSLSGHGVLFALTQTGQYRLLHQFGAPDDGHDPDAVLVDAAGNIYGSAFDGGGSCAREHAGCGTVFKYSLSTKQYSVIYHFTGEKDGANPTLGSIGPDGTLYGATQTGSGLARLGALFALTPTAGGYAYNVLAYSNSTLGAFTQGPTLAPDGVLVGLVAGGLYAYNDGARSLLQAFSTSATGQAPVGQPVIGPGGTVIGTTTAGGVTPCVTSSGVKVPAGCGVLYRYTFQ